MSQGVTGDEGFVNLSNARSKEQEEVMERIQQDAVCPFCKEHLMNYHTNPILKEGKYWLVTKNRWPYKDTKNHLLAISTTHVSSFEELDPEAGAELFELFQETAKELNIVGGGMAMRFGGEGYASSVRHLHAHLIEPDIQNPEHKAVKFPLSKSKGSNPET